MMPFSLFLALKYLKPKRSFISVVTTISVIGVALGVAILVIVLSVMNGFDNMWRSKILSFKPHLTVTGRYGAEIENEEKLCVGIEKIPWVKGVAPCVQTIALMRRSGEESGAMAPIVLGIDPARAGSVSQVPRRIAVGEFDLDGDKVVVGVDIAMQMQLRIGDKVLIYSPMNVASEDEFYLPEELEVTGIFNMGMRDYDGNFVLTSLEVGRELVGLEQGCHAVYVMTDDPFRFEEYTDRLGIELGPEYLVRNWSTIDSVLFGAIKFEKTMMFLLLIFITIVAIFCVTNTIIVITVQKTGEIGLLKALGFSRLQITSAFVWYGWIQCIVGTGCGMGLGLLILENLKGIVDFLRSCNLPVFPKSIYGLDEIPWEISRGTLVSIAVFVIVFCTLSAILPARRAAKLNPAEALRHE